MDNYVKGKNVEHELTRDQIPFKGIHSDCTWLKMKAGTKLKNVVEIGQKGLKDKGSILITGSGPALNKVISCAEVIKRKFSPCYQYNKLCYAIVDEYWDPKTEDLDTLKVERKIPQMLIVLSTNPLSDNQEYQKSLKEFLQIEDNRSKPKRGNKKQTRQLGLSNEKKKFTGDKSYPDKSNKN